MSVSKICLDKIDNIELSVSFSHIDKHSLFTHREIHMHEEYELLVNLEGEKLLELSGKLCAFPENSVIIIKPYEGHRCLLRSEGAHSHFWLLLKIQDELVESLFGDDEGSSVIQLENQNFKRLTEGLLMLSEGKMSELEQYAEVFTMLDILKKGRAMEIVEEKEALTKEVVLALRYMEKHIKEKIVIEELAKASHVSINTLERHFAEYLQLSPSATLRRKRLITAANLLSHGYSVSEACERSGFTDYSNFIATFRKVFGMTPLKYQKSTKK